MGLDPGRIALFNTRADAEYPVEKLVSGEQVMGVRVEVVTDVADVAGSWIPREVIRVETRFVLVADPCHAKSDEIARLLQLATNEDVDCYPGYAVRALAGTWDVEVFVSAEDGDELAVRLLRIPAQT